MFRRIRSAILREPNVILMKLLYVCYVMKTRRVAATHLVFIAAPFTAYFINIFTQIYSSFYTY
jgi:hypothetical protein